VVLIPKGRYAGQMLTRLVSKKTTAAINKTRPNVPERMFVKYKTAITAAITNRIILSAEPMFFFIFLIFV
jgi:hypothetical protein